MTVPYKYIALAASFIILPYCAVYANNLQDFIDEVVPIINNGECGGTIELDRGTLIYPGDGSIQPGELCVWTIHLRTMEGFRMNFTHLDVPGGNSSCHRSSVGIYGLSNLIPRDDLENYRLCNENNNVGNYFLTSYIATVVFYSSSSFPPNNSALGFALHWEGSRFQPVPTEHSASYSVAPSGVIWYPFEGEYPSTSAMTWLVKGVRSADIGPTVVDIDVIFVDLETCNLSDKCLCDAVIIYDVSRRGELHEVDRFCGDKSNGQFQNVNSNFIVAFYTDVVNVPQSGYGFQVVWRQGREITTTEGWGESTTESWERTTTENYWWTTNTEPSTTEDYWPSTTEDYWWTTTTSPPTTTEDYWQTTSEGTTLDWGTTGEPPETSLCGGIIEGYAGVISYKHRQSYQNNERCIWTIRPSHPHTQIYIELLESGFELRHDYISVFGFVQNTGLSGNRNLGQTSNGYQAITIDGSVAILVFSSDSSTTGTGFRLQFRVAGLPSYSVFHFQDYHTNYSRVGNLRYPSYGNYRDGELSTFVITDGNTYNNENHNGIYLEVSIDIEQCTNCGCDGLLIYEFIGGINLLQRLCSSNNFLEFTAHTYIIVFYSDSSVTRTGFQMSWWNDYSYSTTPIETTPS